MDRSTLDDAAKLLAEAYRSGTPLAELPAGLRPTNAAEGHALQDALVRELGATVAGWKVALTADGTFMRGAVLGSRLLASPASIEARLVPMLCIEGEIAFRLERPLPRRSEGYGRDEVMAAITALPAIEVVATRFASYDGTPVLHRLGDLMSNGALVVGHDQPEWQAMDLTRTHAILEIDGEVRVDATGGHANGDPLAPLLALLNTGGDDAAIAPGQIVTTGTLTGMVFVEPAARVRLLIDGFAPVELVLPA